MNCEGITQRIHDLAMTCKRETGATITEIFVEDTVYEMLSHSILSDYEKYYGAPSSEQKAEWLNGLIEIYTPVGRVVIRKERK